MKLYKFRPLSDFLFKELLYQELYFSSYPELNDPLDLSARIEFSAKNEKQAGYIIWFLIKSTIKATLRLDAPHFTSSEVENNRKIAVFSNDEPQYAKLKSKLYNELNALKQVQSFISLEDITTILYSITKDLDLEFNINKFESEIERLTKKFLQNSSVTCFSEVNDDFLMWSHYASKHSGICLEFTLNQYSQFPFQMILPRKENKNKYSQRTSHWKIDAMIFWDRVLPVTYQSEQPFINFFEFAGAFENENQPDLIGLSKGWTHQYAYELEQVFSIKTLQWKYEKEWRAIRINFGHAQIPEERIEHYPIESLSAIYFGMRTAENVKKRIAKIFAELQHSIKFFVCKAVGGKEIIFEEWQYYQD